jgi:hypothetical protein
MVKYGFINQNRISRVAAIPPGMAHSQKWRNRRNQPRVRLLTACAAPPPDRPTPTRDLGVTGVTDVTSRILGRCDRARLRAPASTSRVGQHDIGGFHRPALLLAGRLYFAMLRSRPPGRRGKA